MNFVDMSKGSRTIDFKFVYEIKSWSKVLDLSSTSVCIRYDYMNDEIVDCLLEKIGGKRFKRTSNYFLYEVFVNNYA